MDTEDSKRQIRRKSASGMSKPMIGAFNRALLDRLPTRLEVEKP